MHIHKWNRWETKEENWESYSLTTSSLEKRVKIVQTRTCVRCNLLQKRVVE